MVSLFFLLFGECCRKNLSKRPQTEPTTITGIPENELPPIIEIIAAQPEAKTDESFTDESYLPDDGFESEEEETDSETEEKDYQKFSSATNIREDDEIVLPSTSSSSSGGNQIESSYDKVFYFDTVSQVLLHPGWMEPLSFEFLQQEFPKFLEKIEESTVDRLLIHASLIEIVDEVEKQIPLMNEAKIYRQNCNFVLHSKNGIINSRRIKTKKTKIQAIPNDDSGGQIMGTIMGYNAQTITLRPRESTLTDEQINKNTNFEVVIFPNSQQLSYCINGIDGICGNESMLRKVGAVVRGEQLIDFAFPSLIALGPAPTRVPYLIDNILDIISYKLKVLVCAHSNASVDFFAVNLLGKISTLFPQPNPLPSIRRIIPLIQEVDSRLKDVTIQLQSEKNLASYDIVFCTLGCAPKLISETFSKGHFSHIFIDDSQQASELDTWMAIGNLASEETQIILAGDLENGKKIYTKSKIMCTENLKYCTSMLERLHSVFPSDRVTIIP